MKIDFNSVSVVKVVWAYDDGIDLYESVPKSIVVNPKAKSIRFELRDLYEEEDAFEVIIRENGDSYAFETDHHLVPEGEYPLKEFTGQDEFILHHEDGMERIYFHLVV